MISSALNPITEDDIAHYLANTPDFFERHAEVLAAVQLISPHSKRAVSLQERQAEMLRDKIRMLEMRLMEMIRHGNDNLVLSDKLLRWARGLFESQQPVALPGLIADSIAQQFAVPQVAIKVWGVGPGFAAADFAQDVSDTARQFAVSLTEPYCGLNTNLEVAGWLAQPEQASSLALLPLRGVGDAAAGGGAAKTDEVFGLLVLASPDSQRFTSSMGTDFLLRIAELAGAALSRLR